MPLCSIENQDVQFLLFIENSSTSSRNIFCFLIYYERFQLPNILSDFFLIVFKETVFNIFCSIFILVNKNDKKQCCYEL